MQGRGLHVAVLCIKAKKNPLKNGIITHMSSINANFNF